jgi:hypothetical protein
MSNVFEILIFPFLHLLPPVHARRLEAKHRS